MMSNATCGNTYCKCDWSMKVGTHLFHNGSSESYSSMKLAKIALWSEVVSNETIQEASNDMRGKIASTIMGTMYGIYIALIFVRLRQVIQQRIALKSASSFFLFFRLRKKGVKVRLTSNFTTLL